MNTASDEEPSDLKGYCVGFQGLYDTLLASVTNVRAKKGSRDVTVTDDWVFSKAALNGFSTRKMSDLCKDVKWAAKSVAYYVKHQYGRETDPRIIDISYTGHSLIVRVGYSMFGLERPSVA